MKKILLIIAFVFAVLISAKLVWDHKYFVKNLFKNKESNLKYENKEEPVVTQFSFQSEEPGKLVKTFKHITVKIDNIRKFKPNKKMTDTIPENTPLLITVETWGENEISVFRVNLAEETINGTFDTCFEKISKQLIGNRQNVYVRYNPEMEVPYWRFPWQFSGGSDYIESFRHFSHVVKKYAPQIKVVWGPAGYPGAMEYYPGDDVVDAVSVTLKSNSELPLDVYPKNYPVEYDLFRRLHRLRFTGKPVFVLGSNQCPKDSVTTRVVESVSQIINENRNIIYSVENYKRPDLQKLISGTGKFEIGLYDPQALLIKENAVTTEHLFVDFSNLKDGTFETAFNNVVERKHKVIVTFEPFRIPGQDDDLQVLQHIMDGKYDKEIERLYSIISTTKQQVYLRFAHEMEIPITRYPWQS